MLLSTFAINLCGKRKWCYLEQSDTECYLHLKKKPRRIVYESFLIINLYILMIYLIFQVKHHAKHMLAFTLLGLLLYCDMEEIASEIG